MGITINKHKKLNQALKFIPQVLNILINISKKRLYPSEEFKNNENRFP